MVNMGCSNMKFKELEDLKEELQYLLSEKELLENKLKDKPSQTNQNETVSEQIQNFIDRDLSSSSKVIQFLLLISGDDSQTSKNTSELLSEIKSSDSAEKLSKYIQLKLNESELQDNLCSKVEKYYKTLFDSVNTKFNSIQDRLLSAKKDLKENSSFLSDIEIIDKELNETEKSERNDIEYLIFKLETFYEIEKKLFHVEKFIISSDSKVSFAVKANDIKNSIDELKEASKQNIKVLQKKFGTKEKEPVNGNGVELGDFIKFLDTVNQSLKDLNEIEKIKSKVIESRYNEDTLDWIYQNLTSFFIAAETTKEVALSKLSKLGGKINRKSNSVGGSVKDPEIGPDNLFETIERLKDKTVSFLSVSKEQNNAMLELMDGVKNIENKINDFELKVDEVTSADLKDLQKIIVTSDTESKTKFETIKKELSKTHEKVSGDIIEHINFLYKKLETYERIQPIRKKIRDSQVKEINKTKQDLQDKINELNIKFISIQGEKTALENSNSNLKLASEKTSKFIEELIEKRTSTVKEKEDEKIIFKNTISRLTEKSDQLSKEIASNQREIEGLIKENKDYKKNLRQKEKEITELNEKLSNS
jgi:DNA repair exonuclease SbcCD ATPase subunit